MAEYSTHTRTELIALCKERGIKGYSGKKKDDLVELLMGSTTTGTTGNTGTAGTAGTANTVIVPEDRPIVKHMEFVPGDSHLSMIDLFAGTGAFTHAFQQTGAVSCVFANDMVEWSKQIYDINFGKHHTLTLQDLNTVKVDDIPPHDILTGGFPCQPFSIAGKQEGFDDERSNVFWKILEIIDHHSPQFVILENVKNLVSHDGGRTFTVIKDNLTQRGYYIHTKVLDTAEITGIPQHRERIYIVCIKDKEMYDKFTLDFERVEKRSIESMLDSSESIPAKYYYTESSSTWPLLSEAVTKRNTIYQYRRVYVRENKSNECPTLTANMGGGGHNVPIILDDRGIRKLTPRECFRFQGFPEEYRLPAISDTNLYKLAGNAVSVPVVQLIANRLIGLIGQ